MSKIIYPRAPRGITLAANAPVKIATLAEPTRGFLMVSNLSENNNVFLALLTVGDTSYTAEVDKGIAVFPKSSVRFDDDGAPYKCDVWAVASAETKIAIQD